MSLPKYKVHGEEGIPVLFLGGMMQPHKLLGPFVDMAVADGFQIIRVGYRGHHEGEKESFFIEDIIDDAIKVLDHLQIQKIGVIGEALGGTLALSMAIKYPNRITSLCVNGVISKKDPAIASDFFKWFKTLENEGLEQFISQIMPKMFGNEWEKNNREEVISITKDLAYQRTKYGLLELIKSAQKFRLSEAELMCIKMPILVIKSKYDRIVTPEHAQNLHNLLQNSQLEEFECGHAVSIECPEQMLESYEKFIFSLAR